MADLPLPKIVKPNRPQPSLDEMLAKGREAAAATGQIITGDIPPPPPVAPPAPGPEAPPAASAPFEAPAGLAPASPQVPKPRKPASAATGTQDYRKPGRPPRPANVERERWGIQMRPDLVLGVRRLALDRGISPFDVLEEAATAYLRDQSKR